MPSFQPVVLTASGSVKRKAEDHFENRNSKRVSTGCEGDTNIPVNASPSDAIQSHDQCGWFSGMYLFRGIVEYVNQVSFYRRNHQYKKHKTWDGDAISL